MTLKNEVLKIESDLINQINNKAIIIKALTKDLKIKTLTVLFNSEDAWNESKDVYSIREYLHTNCIQAVLNDQTILGYQTIFCNVNPDLTLVKTSQYEPQATRYFKTS